MKHHFTFLAAFTSVTILCSSHTEASTTSCSVPNNLPVNPSLELWKKTRAFLSPQLENCLNNSNYFSLYGASLLYTGNTSTAIEMLERALLIDPDNGSARIDYALALYQSGQLLNALQVNESLLKEENIPAAVRASLEQRQKVWNDERHLWRHQLSYLYGHNSNLNNATYINDYEIPFFPVDIKGQESGFYHNSRLMSQYYNLTEQGVSRLSISAQTRESRLNESDIDQFSVNFEQDHDGLSLKHSWSAGFEHIRLGDEGLYSSVEGSLWMQPRDSKSYLNINTNYTYFDDRDYPDELTIMLEPGILYSIKKHHFGFNLGLGINTALNGKRRSGSRSLLEASVFYGFPIGKGQFTSRASITETSDSNGYSPVLENNAERSTDTWSLSLQYLYPINSHLTLHSSYYYRNQDSNIPIFRTKAEDFNFGLTFSF